MNASVLRKVGPFARLRTAHDARHSLGTFTNNRCWNTANTTAVTHCLLPMPTHPMTTTASGRLRSRIGTRSSSKSIRRCCSRSSWLLTTWISSPYCEFRPSLFLAPFKTYSGANCGFSLFGPTFSDVGCKTVANMIKGKTPEEIRKLFNIVNDFTPEEEVLRIGSLPKVIDDSLSLSFTCPGTNQEGERVGGGPIKRCSFITLVYLLTSSYVCIIVTCSSSLNCISWSCRTLSARLLA